MLGNTCHLKIHLIGISEHLLYWKDMETSFPTDFRPIWNRHKLLNIQKTI